MTSKAQRIDNAKKFNLVLIEKAISGPKLTALVIKYVNEKVKNDDIGHVSNMAAMRGNIMKELGRDEMSDKVLEKGMAILALGE